MPKSLGHHHDGEPPPAGLAVADLAANGLDVVRDLGDQDGVGAARDAGVKRDPPGVATHHLDGEDPLVGLGGGMEPADGVGGDGDRGVEAKGNDGAVEVVVDGLGHAHHRKALVRQMVGDIHRAVPADGDQSVDTEPPGILDHLVGAVDQLDAAVGRLAWELERVAAIGGPENRSTQVGNASHRVGIELDGVVGVEQAGIAAADSDHVPAAPPGAQGRGADDGV